MQTANEFMVMVPNNTDQNSGTRGQSRHVLLAEDNPVAQRVATAMLEGLDFTVDVAADGLEAVRAATLTSYQAILMDCQIPLLNGFQVTGEIRRLRGASRRTPIIAFSASDLPADRQRALAAGMDDYLTKPLRLEKLARVLARWAPAGSAPLRAVDPVEPLRPLPIGLAGAATPVLDEEVVARLRRLGAASGEDLVGQLTVLFLFDADARVKELRGALARAAAPALVISAHSLCGASGNLGATHLARLCAALATASADGGLSDAAARVDAIEAELARVRTALGSLVLVS